jgi:hypothetical protein
MPDAAAIALSVALGLLAAAITDANLRRND